ncbi:MAG TPA: FAD-dependent oxidoreductase [Bryobacteraceae bacterium]|nr:FAD-dependent oxidoreductase [Bryobacteraceae bacterium]
MSHDFDLAVIGGGAAGLAAARLSVRLGARTALVESNRPGGTRNWTGCIPSKALIKAARVAHLMRTAQRFGMAAHEPEVDFPCAIGRVKAICEEARADEDPRIRMFPARARFVDPHTIQLSNGEKITSRYFLVAAGSRPLIPKIEGIERVSYLTNESVFDLERLPRRLMVVGAGAAGVEMAQAFRRLGSTVTLAESEHRILGRDDAELSYLLETVLREEGIDVRFGETVEKIDGNVVALSTGSRVETDAILFAIGRQVNVADLDLKAAGIRVTEYGVSVDQHCRTGVKHIFAAGDVTGRHQFTHMAEHMATVAVKNALLGARAKIESGQISWCTYSDPELAHVGAWEDQLKNRDVRYEVYKLPYSDVDRAVTESESTGLIKVFVKARTGVVLGTAILGARAGEMIAQFALAIRYKLTMAQLAATILPYPTYASGVKRVAEEWTESRKIATGMRALRRALGR